MDAWFDNMYLYKKHEKRRILNKYKNFANAADNSSNCPAHRFLMRGEQIRMLRNLRERIIIDQWENGRINDEGEDI